MNQIQPSVQPSSTTSSATPSRAPSVWEIYFPRNIEGHRDAVFIASFPQIMYFWPTLIILFLAAFFQGALGVGSVFWGWLTIFIVALNFLVLVQDFDQKQFIIFSLVLVASVLLIWIVNLYGFTFLKSIANWILSFQPTISTDAYLLSGTILLVFFVWGLITPLFSYWKLEQNEFVHYTQPVGRDMSIARTGCTVYKEIPDIIECALSGGGGTLVVRREKDILATIPHIPFLGLRMDAIEHMLSETRVIVDTEGR